MATKPSAQTVRNFLRDAVGVVFIVTVLGVWVLEVTGLHPISLSPYQVAFVDFFVALFTGAAGFVIFGERALTAAGDLYNQFRGEQEA